MLTNRALFPSYRSQALRILLQVPAMSALQIMKAVLNSLAADRTLQAGGVFMAKEPGNSLPQPPPPANFRGHFDVVFVDPSGWLNLAANVSRSALQQVCSRLGACWLVKPMSQYYVLYYHYH